jgi:hypothetical protein
MIESQLYPFLFVMIPSALGILLLLVIWYFRGREF